MTLPESFPSIHLCPKNETGVLNFIQKNETFDGRGVVVAVFDSGIDPGAPGLQVTTTGLPKVIERFDCSGAGDVDTSKVVEKDESGELTTLSGRKLKIPGEWKNPSGKFHLGVKPLFELYTPKVKERMEAKRKEAHWDEKHRLLLAEANRKLGKEKNGLSPKEKQPEPSPIEKLEKEEIEAELEVLQSLEKKYKDLGPLLDCILWEDGEGWRTSLSFSDSEGGLEDSIVLGEYSKTRDFLPLTKADQMNVSVNVWDNGNILEVVGICGSHGTHVSSIAAGYFPENPELNGVAPGAQIMSFTIGDGRLGSMETGTALVRAMAYVMQNSKRIHVINMSYGEHAHWSSVGRIGDLMKEVVDKHGVIWIASAGNHGPALSTVGSPPWLNSNVIMGVGAYVSPEMMSAEYSLRQKLPGMPYSWSSRGPTLDGDLGVSVSAPGGAITSVPNFTLRSAQLMNGTSMAAPHVAGCIALMLSGALAKEISYTPYSVRKSLEQTAQHVPTAEAYAQGHGLVQVEKAFQRLGELASVPMERDVRFNVTVTAGSGAGSGWPMKSIYIRDPPIVKCKEYTVNVDPVFFNEDDVEPEDKINFRMNLCLLSTVPWVQVPPFFDLANLQRSFNVKVDVEGLPKGVNFGKVQAFRHGSKEDYLKPIFEVFVTAVVPEILPSVANQLNRPVLEFGNVLYEPGFLKRYFILVPKGASWAVLNLKMAESSATSSSGTAARFVIHAMTLNPGQSCKADEFYKMLAMNPLEESSVSFKVTEGKVMELVLGRWWSEPAEIANLSGSITFRSLALKGNPSEVVVSAGDSFQKLVASCAYGTEEASPSASLKHQVTLLRPTESKIVSLTEPRDMIPPSRVIYQLENSYSFSVSRSTEVSVNCCLLSDTLYESEYESQMWQLYDKNKRYLGCGDAYPSKWNVKVEKGEYVLRLHVRHEKREALEKLMFCNSSSYTSSSGTNGSSSTTSFTPLNTWTQDTQIPGLPVLLTLKLPSSITLDMYQNQYELQDYKGSKKGSGWNVTLKRESHLNLFLSTNISDKSLKNLASSSTLYLQGSLTLHKDEAGKKLISYPLKIAMIDPPSKPKSSKDSVPGKSKTDEMTEQLRDLQINWIPKLESEESRKLYEQLLPTWETHLPLHIARLQFLDNGETEPSDSVNGNAAAKSVETCEEIVKIADKILSLVDQPAVLASLGSRSPLPQEKKQQMEKQKNAVIEALVKKGNAMSELMKKGKGSSIDSLDEILLETQKYLDIGDARVVEFSYNHAVARKQYSRALRLLFKHIEADPTKWNAEVDKKIKECFSHLGWNHCLKYWENVHLLRYPSDFRPF